MHIASIAPRNEILMRFVRERGLMSGGLAYLTMGQVSHVDAILPADAEFPGYALGARSDRVKGIKPGVQIRPPDYATFTYQVLYSIPCTMLQRQSFYGFLYSQVDKPYDFAAIWGFLFARNWREQDSWICSELMMAAAESADIIDCLDLPANKITPVMACLIVSSKRARARIPPMDDMRMAA